MSKRKIESYIIAAAVAAFISGFGAGTAAEQHTQEDAARQQSTEMVTLQIYNETQKTYTRRLPGLLLRGRYRPFTNNRPDSRFTGYRKEREESYHHTIFHATGTLQRGDQRRRRPVQHFQRTGLSHDIGRASGKLQRRVRVVRAPDKRIQDSAVESRL